MTIMTIPDAPVRQVMPLDRHCDPHRLETLSDSKNGLSH